MLFQHSTKVVMFTVGIGLMSCAQTGWAEGGCKIVLCMTFRPTGHIRNRFFLAELSADFSRYREVPPWKRRLQAFAIVYFTARSGWMGAWCIVIEEMFLHSQEGIELIYKKSFKLDERERDWVSAQLFIVLHTDWLTARCGYWNLLFVSPWRYVLCLWESSFSKFYRLVSFR